MAMRLRSPAFEDGSTIPRKYTRDGENRSPPLEWSGAPPGTRSFLVVMEDPDAPSGMFRHWAVYNVPPGDSALPEGAPVEALGINDFGRRAYDGPEPPKGHGPHRYHTREVKQRVARSVGGVQCRAKVQVAGALEGAAKISHGGTPWFECSDIIVEAHGICPRHNLASGHGTYVHDANRSGGKAPHIQRLAAIRHETDGTVS